MPTYVLRRLLGAIPLLLVISLICYSMMALAPGGPTAMLSQNPSIRPQDIEQIRKNFGLDRPVHVRYVKWLGRIVLHGDLATSYKTGRPVAEMIGERIPATLELMTVAFSISLCAAFVLGILSAVFRYTFFDFLVTLGSYVGISLPSFWFGLLAMLVFAQKLQWLPSAGRYSLGGEPTWSDMAAHLVLPAMVLGLLEIASWSRYLRSSLLEVLHLDYMRTARAKGLTALRVVLHHGVRNALIPFVTVVTLQIPSLFTGAIITETIFAWPGIGRLYLEAISFRDYTVLMGILMISSTLIVLSNLLADILYAVLDPRISYR
ncbi:MAG: ABC transporter permease [Acidobacteriota bacterium]